MLTATALNGGLEQPIANWESPRGSAGNAGVGSQRIVGKVPYILRSSLALPHITCHNTFNISPYTIALALLHSPITAITAPRRASTRGGSTSRANRNRAPGGIRRNTRSRQQPNRYGHPEEQPSIHPHSQAPSDPPSDSDEAEPSTREYSYSSSSSTNTIQQSRSPVPQQSGGQQQETPTLPSEPDARPLSAVTAETSINLNTMRELLRSHEQDIVDQVVL
ncbi:hypothetical protein HOY80DRAFT_1097526 [Tuber brumale]|nr:hypothetical protein HOY80DRAFT_1097526 [Tuber brumale]